MKNTRLTQVKVNSEEILVQYVATGLLKPATYNPRKWNEDSINQLSESIKRFGLVDPIIVNGAPNRANIVIGGHFRLEVAKKLGFTEVPVVYVNIPDIEKEKELNLRLNRNTGDWDWKLLADFDEGLLTDIGFNSEELDDIFDIEGNHEEFDLEKELRKLDINSIQIKKGDIYQLGDHLLMCGDSTIEADILRLMGFTPHPTDPKVFFSSGHPSFGGNLGFQKSTDGGFTWEKVSNGVAGPVDFHALTVSPVNPNLLYGWFRNSLQRSTDGGKNWEVVQSNLSDVVSLTADPKKEDNLYAATSKGLWFSQNKGSDWALASEATKDSLVSAFTIHPTDSQILLSFSQVGRLIQSSDGGKNWEKVTEDFGGEMAMYLAYSKQNPEIVYSLTMKNAIYKSNDAGKNWTKIR